MGKATQIIAVILSATLVASPFIGLVSELSKLDPGILKPCNEGCTFIRYWGTPDMPRTSERSLPGANAGDNSTSTSPTFVTVRNGESTFEMNSVTDWYTATPRGATDLALLLSTHGGALINRVSGLVLFNETPGIYIAPVCNATSPEKHRQACESWDVKRGVMNHLKAAPTLKIYLFAVVLWAFFRILHDCLVIVGVPERITLTIGFISIYPQIVAFCSGFLWAVGAAEVFQSRAAPDKSPCYYELEPLPMFAILATPAALYWATRDKLWKLGYAVLHGDYLFSVAYDVPYAMTSQYNSDPAYSFLSIQNRPEAAVHPQSTCERARSRSLDVDDYSWLSCLMAFTNLSFQFFATYLVYCFAFPTLTVRLYGLVAALPSWVGQLCRFLFIALTVGASGYSCYHQLLRVKGYATMAEGAPRAIHEFTRPLLFALAFDSVRLMLACMYLVWCWCPLLVCADLWQGEPLTVANAGHIGAAGFFLLVVLMASYHPSSTPLSEIIVGIGIAGGVLPRDGLKGILAVHEKYPHLGLHRVAACVRSFQQDHGVTGIDDHSWVSDPVPSRLWLDRLKQGPAPTPTAATPVTPRTLAPLFSIPCCRRGALVHVSFESP